MKIIQWGYTTISNEYNDTLVQLPINYTTKDGIAISAQDSSHSSGGFYTIIAYPSSNSSLHIQISPSSRITLVIRWITIAY